MSTALSGCVASLRSSISLLESSIATLDSGVHDFPRLAKVLQTTRHFELLPESALQAAQASLLSTLTPEMGSLLGRVEARLERMARREAALVAKYELQEGRLSSVRASGGGGGAGAGGGRRKSVGRGTGEGDGGGSGVDVEAGREALRLKQTRQKKERLSYAVERLTLQAQQRERQLRMSMAAPQ